MKYRILMTLILIALLGALAFVFNAIGEQVSPQQPEAPSAPASNNAFGNLKIP